MTEFSDEGIVLRVEDRDTSDKYVTCFSRNHGRVRFVAYGARYQKSVVGRILQPFAHLNLELQTGNLIDKLRSCELQSLPVKYDFKQMAYAAVVTELTEVFTADHEPEEQLFLLLQEILQLINKRNPRLVTLLYTVKLLASTGFRPQMDECVLCHKGWDDETKMFFSALQGGVLCEQCGKDEELMFGKGARELYYSLAKFELDKPTEFSVQGSDLMQLEKALLKFIVFQTDKPLKSLAYLSQIGL